jgi:uroporphyrin-3 C-methyltransferase
LFLLELAQRRLTLDRDVETAIVALESADARLASLRDTSFTAVRQQIAKDLLSLRAVRRPDVTGILARLAGTEEQAMRMSVKGIVVVERTTALQPTVPQGVFTRAWNIATATVRNLVTVRKVDDQAASVVTAEEQLLRRQHLQLLLFSARTAVARHDAAGYRSALARARQWIGEFFDLADPAVQSLLAEVQALEPINIDPQLPDVSTSLRLLQKLMPVRSGPE